MSRGGKHAGRYEAGFAVFLAVLAFLGRGNPQLTYPQFLYLLLVLLALNLAAAELLRRRPEATWIAAAFILANCATLTAIQGYSGGADSNLWVLYLLPVLSAGILLEARQVGLVTCGVILVSGAYSTIDRPEPLAVILFETTLKTGLYGLTGLFAWRMAAREHEVSRKLAHETERAEQLTAQLDAAAALGKVGLVGAGVAHDLKNSFMVVSGFAETLKTLNPGLSEESNFAMERIRKVAELGSRTAQQLSIHGAAAPLELSREDLGSIASDTARLLKGSFGYKGVDLHVETEADCPVLASRVHLQRVFMNLLLNALAVSRKRQAVRLAVSKSKRHAVAVVEDEGPGFAKEALPKLFTAFESRRGHGGTGLGLHLSARIVKDHKGTLAAENRAEGGARLTIRIPLS